MVNFASVEKLLRNKTVKRPSMHFIKKTVYQGWPETIRDAPADSRLYWCFRDEVESEILFKGRQILIPESMGDDLLYQLH